ncbi:MAG: VOC family protein [Chloroflexi bacterium]|nr:VOC family protein [Chloroflexota bacterium]MDA1270470.1 VOC family protein [Chloroflexota bacterium]
MPEITSHFQGTPSWVELVTTDDQGAMAFYSALFGWVDDPQEMGPGMYYHLQKLNGLEVAAIYQQGAEEREQGVPPHWRTYFAVDDIQETTASVTKAGATVIMGPMQVFDAGHAAIIQDPLGAVFALWQANEHIGVRLKGETGALMWNELLTTDPARAVLFYSGLLGLGSSKMPGPDDYTLLNAGGTDVAGVMKITEDMGPIPPNWSVYFGVDDVDATVEKSVSLGATTIVPAMDIPGIGRLAGFQDPQGAMFLVFKPAA